MLDEGKARHCGRDEYVAYLRRAVKAYRMVIHEHTRVLNVSRDGARNKFEITTRSTASHKALQTQLHSANAVVLAFGSASTAKTVHLDAQLSDGARVSSRLEGAALYRGRHVLVVGTGPSGMESAVRLCSAHYGAVFVTMASRSKALSAPFNDYVNQSLYRIHRFISEGRMRLVLRSSLASANSTHATLRLLPEAGHSQVDVVVRADYIITAIGFTTDAALVRSIGFRSNFLDRLTYETSVRGIFNLGVSGVRPWTDRRSKGRLGMVIEDTQGQVHQVCTAILRHLATLVCGIRLDHWLLHHGAAFNRYMAAGPLRCAEICVWGQGGQLQLGSHRFLGGGCLV